MAAAAVNGNSSTLGSRDTCQGGNPDECPTTPTQAAVTMTDLGRRRPRRVRHAETGGLVGSVTMSCGPRRIFTTGTPYPATP
jgi:hypothetical protein